MTTPIVLANRLRTEINAGLWPPGTPLRQEDLAEKYGVSRIPVREALQVLCAEGLVRIEPNRGASVARIEPDDVHQIFELRALVETFLVEMATPNHDKKSLIRLRAIQSELEHDDEIPGWLANDMRFHETLYAPAGRPRALALALALRAQLARFVLPEIGPNQRRTEWDCEHRALICAIELQQPDEASRLLREHLEGTKALVLKHLAAGGSQAATKQE